jgi:hypothetical protein
MWSRHTLIIMGKVSKLIYKFLYNPNSKGASEHIPKEKD